MASPKIEVVVFYDAATGAPLPGLTPTIIVYRRDDGTDLIGSAPAISAIGGGAYKFTPVSPFADPNQGITYVIDAGATAAPRYVYRHMRPEDWNDDGIPAIKADTQRIKVLKEGRWKIFTSGGDANRLVLYDTDGTTVLQKWDLKDAAGAPTTTSLFERVPVNVIP